MKPEKIKVWYVIGNTDNTEGRGRNIVLHTCMSKATASRLSRKKGVMGSDAHIEEGCAFKDNNSYYGKVYIEQPTSEDIALQGAMKAMEELVNKAKDLGLSDQDIAKLSGR